ncbi:MAG: response regulator [Elusimicrobia bacterium]|nr:response regulator [Elusimicrobiota bacterium]
MKSEKETETVKPESILVVDDDDNILDLCSNVLNLEGYQVVLAHNGEEVLSKIKSLEFDIVLTDHVKLPKGESVTCGIKSHCPETDVIVMTGSPTLEKAISAFEEGASDYLIKPFDMERLKEVLNRCVQKRQMQKNAATKDQLKNQVQSVFSELNLMARLNELAGGIKSDRAWTELVKNILTTLKTIQGNSQNPSTDKQPKDEITPSLAQSLGGERLAGRMLELLDKFHQGEIPQMKLRAKDLVVDLEQHEVMLKGKTLKLTPTEFDLLALLMVKRGKVLRRTFLYEVLWDNDMMVTSQTLAQHIKNLRAKLGPYAHYIETLQTIGYRFRVD